MSNILLKPNDAVDLSLLLESYGGTIATFYPVAYVYDPLNNPVQGMPFDLLPIGNNLYVANNAFQATVNSGTYKIIYIVYEDSAHTIKSTTYGERHDTITISIQAVSGPGYGGVGDVVFDDTFIRELFKREIGTIKDQIEAIDKRMMSLQQDFDDGLKVDLTEKEVDLSSIENSIGEIKSIVSGINSYKDNSVEIIRANKQTAKDVIEAIKKNRSAIIKNKFDKKMMLPVIETISNQDYHIRKFLKEFNGDVVNTLSEKSDETIVKFTLVLEKMIENNVETLNDLNESVRVKLKYALEKMLFLSGKNPNQNINITLKKDENE